MPAPETDRRAGRRTFLERAAAGAAALAALPMFGRTANAEESSAAPATEPWLAPLTGKHKQVFDAPSTNGGFPLLFAFAYRGTMTMTYKLKPGDVSAIIIARHMGIPLVLNDDVWAKYQIGKFFNITDPQTKAPSTRNIFYKSQAGDILNTEASADKLIAAGVVIGACNVALTVLSGMAGGAVNIGAEQAYADWKAGLIPGAHIVPSGVLAVGRSQEHGCTYCFAG
jgi:hypothetical protein